ncbi:MAG: hypothetical protein JWM27_3354 [Gemmatimonadetes bacterium]|nr:hypothetical protein [Gemmatimonadota bacterium]
MMRRARVLLRCAMLALQLALPVLAPIADAILEAEGARARPHVETRTGDSCPRPHSDDCALCRFMQDMGEGPSDPAPLPVAEVRFLPLRWTAAAFVARRFARSPLPRGPPTLS